MERKPTAFFDIFGGTLKELGILDSYRYKNGTLVLEVPGFTKSDLKITLNGRLMKIEGKKEILGEMNEVSKTFNLPEGSLNSNDAITAKVEDGLLFVNLSKTERSKQTVVDII